MFRCTDLQKLSPKHVNTASASKNCFMNSINSECHSALLWERTVWEESYNQFKSIQKQIHFFQTAKEIDYQLIQI